MRAALVLNPGAREGDLAPEEVVERLARAGVAATPLPGAEGGLEAALEQAIAEGHDVVIVGGGDGTLSTASSALYEKDVTLGILPLGTANDFARSVGIPRDLDAACAIIAAGHTIDVDVGVANGRHFLNVASIGLPAKVAAEITPDLKKHLGVLAYPIAALRAFTRQRPFGVRLMIDGRPRRVRWVMQLAVGSGRHYGGGLTLTDAAQPTDGQLHLHVITAPNVRALLWTMRHLRSGRYAKGDSALRFHAQAVHVETRRPHRVNVDGEIVGYTPLKVTLCPRCLRVFAPQPPQSPEPGQA